MTTQQPSSSSGRRDEVREVKVGQFRRLESIGKGSFAVVYKAVHPSNGSLVAIKTVQHAQLKGKLKANLFSEIEILKSIHHPHIVGLITILESTNHIHLVMEFCQLGDLATFVKKRDKLAAHPVTAEAMRHYPNPPGAGFNEVIVRHFAKQLAAALEFLRSKNLVHRDLKPQNLLLNPPPSWIAKEKPENRPYEVVKDSFIPIAGIHSLPALKIADFGFARHLPTTTMAETLCGSPLYMAPEILRYEKYDAKADLWSVGTVLYELMVGKPPFRAANHVDLLRKIEKTMDRIKFPDELEVSDNMKVAVRALLKKMPTERISWESFFQLAVLTEPIPGLVASDRPPAQTQIEEEVSEPQVVQSKGKEPLSEDQPAQDALTEAEPPAASRPKVERAATAANSKPAVRPVADRRPSSPELGRPSLHSHPTAPAAPVTRQDRPADATAMERRTSQEPHSSGSTTPKEHLERERLAQRNREKAAREKAAQDVQFERDYVVVEKRAVEVNAFADELAASPQIQNARRDPNAHPAAQMTRRATAQGIPASAPGAPSSPTRQMQVAIRNGGGGEIMHQRKLSNERRVAPPRASATSALANALNMVNLRFAGSPLTPLLGKTPSPPQGYGPFPAFPATQTGPLVLSNSKPVALEEDQRVLNTIEESATRSDVVYGFAEVKYKQLIPIAPSNDNALGIKRPGDFNQQAKAGSEDDDDLTADAIVGLSEEALVLYVKALAILNNTINLAGTWWAHRSRGEVLTDVSASPKTIENIRPNSAAVGIRVNHVVQWARNRFNECLEKSEYVSRRLLDAQKKLPASHPGHPSNHQGDVSLDPMQYSDIRISSGATAEKLMYDRALEMNKSAAVNELVGEDLPGCEVSYLTAVRLLEAVLEKDDEPAPSKNGARKVKEGKEKDSDEAINGIEEGDRSTVIKLIDGTKQRLHTLRKKINMQKAARRNSGANQSAAIAMARTPSR